MVLLTKIASNVNLKTPTMLTKRLILVAWLGPGHVSVYGYIVVKIDKIRVKVVKIWTEICKDGKRVNKESF